MTKFDIRRTVPIIIKFEQIIDDEKYDELRTVLYNMFPVSMTEQFNDNIIITIVPEGMVTNKTSYEIANHYNFVGSKVDISGKVVVESKVI